MIKITFPDGAVREYAPGTSALEIAKSISEGLARKIIAANVNGQVWDATRLRARAVTARPTCLGSGRGAKHRPSSG